MALPLPTAILLGQGDISFSTASITPVDRTGCVTVVPNTDGFVPAGSCNALWEYYPSLAAAVIFSVSFGILLISHTAQAYMFKKKFCWVLIMAIAWELGSFVTRAVAVQKQQNQALAIVSQILVLLAPLWINAFVYMVFARLVYFLTPSRKICRIRASFIAVIFVWLDVVSFFIQLIGGLMASPGGTPEQVQKGFRVYVGGVGIQELWILVVAALMAVLWTKTRKLEQTNMLRGAYQRGWRTQLSLLSAVLGLITVRIIFRLVEFSAGDDASNPILFAEWYFYVFDAAPVLVAIALLGVFHPGRFLKGPFSDFPHLTKAQKKAVFIMRMETREAAQKRGEGLFRRTMLEHKLKRDMIEKLAAES